MKKLILLLLAIVVLVLLVQSCKKKEKDPEPLKIDPTTDNKPATKSTKDWAIDPESTSEIILLNDKRPWYMPEYQSPLGDKPTKPVIDPSDIADLFKGSYQVEDEEGAYIIEIERTDYNQVLIKNFARRYDLPGYTGKMKGRMIINGYGVFNGVEVYMSNTDLNLDYIIYMMWTENNQFKTGKATLYY